MTRVAIIGSCITRDLWPILGEAPKDLLYISRTSLPSLVARPVAGIKVTADPPAGLTRHQHRAVCDDLAKTALATLVAHRPTHLIFDFIDERFDLLTTGDALATHSWELEASNYRGQPALANARIVPRTSAECGRLWREACHQIAGLIAQTPLKSARLILHESRWAETFLDDEGALRDFDRDLMIFEGNLGRIDTHNDLLQSYQTQFQTLTGAHRVQADPGLIVADARHRWGLSPFHYVEEYYHDIWRQLHALGI